MLIELNSDITIDFHPSTPLFGGTFTTEEGEDVMERDIFNYVYDNIKGYDNPVFIDVGANSGLYSVMNKAKGFKIYSFEPHPILELILKENIRRNNCNSEVFVTALGDEEKESYLSHYDQPWKAGYTHIQDDIKIIPVQIKRMDSLIKEKPTHIKIDVEGYELYVLKGMGELLSDLPELFIELNDTLLKRAGTSKKEVYDFLKEKGYKYQSDLGEHNYHITTIKDEGN